MQKLRSSGQQITFILTEAAAACLRAMLSAARSFQKRSSFMNTRGYFATAL